MNEKEIALENTKRAQKRANKRITKKINNEKLTNRSTDVGFYIRHLFSEIIHWS